MSVKPEGQKGAASGEATKSALPTDDELEQRLAQLRDDISHGGRVPEAREAVKVLEARWPEDPRVQYWARVLAPRVTPTPEAHRHRRPIDRERAWLKQHAREYPGCWLAVYEDRLIAADPDFEVVLSEARKSLGEGKAFLHYQPGEKERHDDRRGNQTGSYAEGGCRVWSGHRQPDCRDEAHP